MISNLSVVVPVYNVEQYLPRCLDSLLSQTRQPEEIILVDDGSTDGSGAICDEYERKHNIVIAIHQTNQGLSAARNAGIDAARFDRITFVDSDDYIEPSMYADLLEIMDREEADIAVGGFWTEKEQGEKYHRQQTPVKLVMTAEEALIQLNSYRYYNMSFCDKVFDKKLFDDLRFPVGKLCEDYYLMHRVIGKAKKVAYTSTPYYHYVQRGNSISRGKKINYAPLDACQAQLAYFQQYYPDLTYVAETACAFSNMAIYNSHVRNDVPCEPALKRRLKQTARKYLGSVIKNPHIPSIKKVQAFVFCVSLKAYGAVVARRTHR